MAAGMAMLAPMSVTTGTATPAATHTPTPTPTTTPQPVVAVFPAEGCAGQVFTFTGSHFTPNGLVHGGFDDPDREYHYQGSFYTDSSGGFVRTIATEVNWLVDDAIKMEVPIPVISQSVMQLLTSRDRTKNWARAVTMMRHGFGGHPYGHDEAIARERREGRVGGFYFGER